MLKRAVTVALAAVTVPSLLACCGIWDQASAQAVAEQCQELSFQLIIVDDGPNKDRAQALLDQCYLDGSAGSIGIVDISMFAVEVETVTGDGEISDVEIQALENKYESLMND